MFVCVVYNVPLLNQTYNVAFVKSYPPLFIVALKVVKFCVICVLFDGEFKFTEIPVSSSYPKPAPPL